VTLIISDALKKDKNRIFINELHIYYKGNFHTNKGKIIRETKKINFGEK
jgi:hypothetical protein